MLGILFAAYIFWTGCRSGQVELFLEHPIKQTFVSHSNPIEGWPIWVEAYSRPINKVISDDYQDYINKLPPKEKENASVIGYFQDGKGQHAIELEVSVNGIWDGTQWDHVLIYDLNGKRVKVVKYLRGYYSL
jgi:hypothetical protein